MNSLFGDFFRKFGGVFLEVCETIWGVSGGYLGGIWEEIGRIFLRISKNFLGNS